MIYKPTCKSGKKKWKGVDSFIGKDEKLKSCGREKLFV